MMRLFPKIKESESFCHSASHAWILVWYIIASIAQFASNRGQSMICRNVVLLQHKAKHVPDACVWHNDVLSTGISFLLDFLRTWNKVCTTYTPRFLQKVIQSLPVIKKIQEIPISTPSLIQSFSHSILLSLNTSRSYQKQIWHTHISSDVKVTRLDWNVKSLDIKICACPVR